MAPATRHRLSPGELIAAGAAVVLLLSLFLPWFREEAVGRFSTEVSPLTDFAPRSQMAWVAIPLVALPLAALAMVPLLNAAKRLRSGTSLRAEVLLASGALAVALVLLGASLHLGEQGDPLDTGDLVSASPSFGLWIALVAALAVAGGGAVGMWSKRPTQDGPGGPASS